MIQTTTSHPQQHPEQTALFSQDEHNILHTVTCTICDAGYAPSPDHHGLLLAPPTVLEAAFMSMCHFCFRCRRPACPACWDVIHGVCGACVQEASLPFRADATPLNGILFPPVQRSDINREKTTPLLLVCIRPGRFQTNTPLSTNSLHEIAVSSTQTQLEEASEKRSAPATQASKVTLTLPENDDEMLKQPGAAVRFIKLVERFVTTISLIFLLALAVIIVLAEVSGTANAQIEHFLHVDIRYEIGYLIALVRQIHF